MKKTKNPSTNRHCTRTQVLQLRHYEKQAEGLGQRQEGLRQGQDLWVDITHPGEPTRKRPHSTSLQQPCCDFGGSARPGLRAGLPTDSSGGEVGAELAPEEALLQSPDNSSKPVLV